MYNLNSGRGAPSSLKPPTTTIKTVKTTLPSSVGGGGSIGGGGSQPGNVGGTSSGFTSGDSKPSLVGKIVPPNGGI